VNRRVVRSVLENETAEGWGVRSKVRLPVTPHPPNRTVGTETSFTKGLSQSIYDEIRFENRALQRGINYKLKEKESVLVVFFFPSPKISIHHLILSAVLLNYIGLLSSIIRKSSAIASYKKLDF